MLPQVDVRARCGNAGAVTPVFCLLDEAAVLGM